MIAIFTDILNIMDYKTNYLRDYANKYKKLIDEIDFLQIKLFANIFKKYKHFMIFGNGGSSSIASHFSTDAIKILEKKCLMLNNFNFISCYSNDFGHENWVQKSIESMYLNSTIVILISSSGKSINMINAANYCKKRKIPFITLTGFYGKNKLSKLGDIKFIINSKNYNMIENIHQYILLTSIDYLANK